LNEQRLTRALQAWGLKPLSVTLVAARENQVYRVETAQETLALRIHRPGLRSHAMLHSELLWMAMLREQGLRLPRPMAQPTGDLLMDLHGAWVDVLSWTPGQPLGQDGSLSVCDDLLGVFSRLGAEMARLHAASDRWTPPQGFTRPVWNAEGLLGDEPLWGHFWRHPDLDADSARRLHQARSKAVARLAAYSGDYGLIHADLVPENVILDQGQPQLIDFDDGGWGFRLFDLATSMNRADRAVPDGQLSRALCEGYLSERDIDLSELPLFRALRSFSYLGWIVPRLHEPGARARSHRFMAAALQAADALNSEER
jgi:Ser/Thr protein kinase RdoA (MazF antagonist)